MKRTLAVFVASTVALLCLASDASGQAGTTPAVLSDGAVEIRFAPPEDGLGCAGIVNWLVAGERFVEPRPQGATLWEIFLRDAQAPTNEPLRVNNRAPAKNRVFEKSGETVRLLFKGVDLPGESRAMDVTATVSPGATPGETEWRISVTVRSKRWAVSDVRYPYLSNIGAGRPVDLLEPSLGMGARLLKGYGADAPSLFRPYPGGYPMACAYMRGGGGIYLGAHDPDQCAKGALFRHGHDFCFSHVAENAGVPGKADGTPRYPVVVKAFKGDWWEAAREYRRWALAQKWSKPGTTADRTDYPRRMAELDLAFVAQLYANIVSNYVQKLSRNGWEKYNKIVEWTIWGNQPYDCGYPDLLPPRHGVKETAQWADREHGVGIMPYTNARLWAMDSVTFQYAVVDAVKDISGAVPVDFRVKKWNRRFAAMCPAAAQWQEVLVSNTIATVEATGATAIYLDQITCACVRGCYDRAHGHTLGGGSWWTDGYRKSLSKIHAKLAPRNIPIVSEEGGDAWNDVVDGHLLPSMATDDEVPFYPAVYSAYSTYLGTNVNPEGIDFGIYFRKIANATIWGVVPGWMYWADRVKYAKYGEALKRAAAFRAANRDFLCYGFLEGDFVSPDGVVAARWTDAARRREAVAFANLTEHPVEVSAFGQACTIAPYSFAMLRKNP